MRTLQEAIESALRGLDLKYSVDPQQPNIVVIVRDTPTDLAVYHFNFDEDDTYLEIAVELVTAPPSRRAKVALLVAECGTTYRCVSFGMNRSGAVYADVGLDLELIPDSAREQAISDGFFRLVNAFRKQHASLHSAVRGRGSRSRLDRELEQILRTED